MSNYSCYKEPFMQNEQKKSASLLAALALGTFMSALDTSAVTVASATIQKSFQVNLATVEWVITGYLLIISGLLLTFGRLADIVGRRRIYATGFAIFTLGSLLCGFSASVGLLIVMRVVQAIGAAMMFSASSAIIAANVPAAKRRKAFGLIAVAVAVACCVGPVVGGLLIGTAGWRAIFLVNVPIGIFGTVLALRFVPRDENLKREPFDVRGSVLAFFALLLILLPLDLSASAGFSMVAFCVIFAAGIGFALAFVQWERRAAVPMLNLKLFQNRVFSACLAAAAFNYAAQFMMAFLGPYYFQNVRGMTPAMSGLLYMPMPLATMIVAPISGSFSDRHDSRTIGAAGMAVMAGALGMLVFVGDKTPDAYIAVAMALAGVGSGMFQSPNNSAIMGSAPAEHRGSASGTLATVRNVGMVLGVALSGAIFHAATRSAGTRLAADGFSGIELERATATFGVHAAFFAAALTAALAMTASLKKGKRESATVSKRG